MDDEKNVEELKRIEKSVLECKRKAQEPHECYVGCPCESILIQCDLAIIEINGKLKRIEMKKELINRINAIVEEI